MGRHRKRNKSEGGFSDINPGITREEPAGIYIHVPFCTQKCPYCDFYSITDQSLQNAFIRALIGEMDMNAGVSLRFDSLYIGGGTPSVLAEGFIGQIVETAFDTFDILSNAEITLEVNPGTVTEKTLRDYRLTGVNRLNIGCQSFQTKNLTFLGRAHTVKDACMAVKWGRSAGFDNIGLDMIYGIPGQTISSWKNDLQKAVSYAPEHLSCYMLTYAPETPMESDRKQGRLSPMPDRQVGDLFRATIAYLTERGYEQYEISNFARIRSDTSNGNRSRHNRKYWTYVPYIGLGPSAHAFIPPLRRWNHRNVARYIRDIDRGKPPIQGKERLNRQQCIIEAIYLGLRQTQGIDIEDFERRFNLTFQETFSSVLSNLEKEGHIQLDPKTCALTQKGMLFLDSIASMFVSLDF